MKLKEFIDNLNNFVTENPESLDLDVVYSTDDEGNGYNKVNFEPCLGFYEDREFKSVAYDEEDEDVEIPLDEYNSVCIN